MLSTDDEILSISILEGPDDGTLADVIEQHQIIDGILRDEKQ